MGLPTVDDLKAMIRMNLIKNNVVTTEDVNLAMKAYGPDISGIKGKTMRQKPTTVVNNTVENSRRTLGNTARSKSVDGRHDGELDEVPYRDCMTCTTGQLNMSRIPWHPYTQCV
jgi:hypothetical protein